MLSKYARKKTITVLRVQNFHVHNSTSTFTVLANHALHSHSWTNQNSLIRSYINLFSERKIFRSKCSSKMAAVGYTARCLFILVGTVLLSSCHASYENLYCGQDNCYDGMYSNILIFSSHIRLAICYWPNFRILQQEKF